MRNFIKKITEPLLKKIFFKYYSKSRVYVYKGICVTVHPEVFPPHFTISTKIFLDFLSKQNLNGKSVLELGCGSGIISLLCASKGAIVTASDINKIALQKLKEASAANDLAVDVIYSNLFESISSTFFDYIIINPPYYPKTPKNTKEEAWFCGENFEYFENLFHQLSTKLQFKNTLMILSQDCDLKRIQTISSNYNLKMQLIVKKRKFFEENYIYTINVKHPLF